MNPKSQSAPHAPSPSQNMTSSQQSEFCSILHDLDLLQNSENVQPKVSCVVHRRIGNPLMIITRGDVDYSEIYGGTIASTTSAATTTTTSPAAALGDNSVVNFVDTENGSCALPGAGGLTTSGETAAKFSLSPTNSKWATGSGAVDGSSNQKPNDGHPKKLDLMNKASKRKTNHILSPSLSFRR